MSVKVSVHLVEGKSEPSTSAGFFCSCSSRWRSKGWGLPVSVRSWGGFTEWFHRRFLFLLFAPAFFVASTAAQNPSEEQTGPEVKKIEFDGNETLSDKALLSVMMTKESPGNISSFFYEHFGERLGSRREYFDQATFEADLGTLRAFYRDNGFFSVVIDTVLSRDSMGRAVSVKFIIQEGYRSLVDTARYVGLDSINPLVHREVYSSQKVRIGSPFSAKEVTEEQARILGLLHNQGYPEAKLDSAVIQLRLSTNDVNVILTFHSGREYRFGKISISPEGATMKDIDSSLVFHHLEFATGQVYSLERKLETERNLSRSGVFETVRVDARFPSLDDTSRGVPITITLKPRDKHELTPELFVNDEDNAFNLGMGLGYNNRNFFGSARNFLTRGRLRVQSIQRISFLKMFTPGGFRQPSLVANAELTFQLLQPYIFTNSVSGTWTFSLIADKKIQYLQSIVRNKIGISNQFSEHTFGFFDWSVERMAVEIFDSSAAAQFTEEQRPQLNSILVATVQRDMTNDILSPSSGLFSSVSLEEAGLVPTLLKNFGSSLPFSQYYKMSAYARWYDDLTKDRYAILAMKLKGGFAEPYRFRRNPGEENLPVPLNRRFFEGGSGSVRGWRARELGAMDRPQFGGDAIFEASVESRINILKGAGDFWWLKLSNIWTVLFLDIGNVWTRIQDARLDQLAVASGLGIRYDTIFGPVRIDFGFKVYDPGQPEGQQWLTSKRFWRDTLANGVLNFGIGQAF